LYILALKKRLLGRFFNDFADKKCHNLISACH
jgi:hypothetical protein